MTLYELISSAVIILAILVVVSCLWHESRARISPTPVLPWVRRKALALALRYKAAEKGPYRIADLGCGWGGLLAALSRRYKGSKLVGYEISPAPLWISRIRAILSGERFSVRNSDFFAEDLSGYDIVFCYLSPYHMEALKPQLEGLKKGSIVVSCSFAIPGWECAAQDVSKGIVDIPVYLYVM